MSIRVLIVEDEVLVAEDIATDLKQFGFDVLDTLISGDECLEKFNELNPDVVIMDINIKGSIDGVETAKRLNEKQVVPIIYLTANSDQRTLKKVLDIFPASFLSKPYNRNDLMIAIEVAYNASISKKYNTPSKQTINSAIFIKSNNQYKRIKLDDIMYLEGSGSYAKIYAKDDEYLVSYNLSHFEKIIEHDKFKRIHRSYIINIDYVEAIEGNSLIINGKSFPVSKFMQKHIMSLFRKL